MPNLDRIEINPKVMMGKPVVKGTRISVDLILRKLGKEHQKTICSTLIPGSH